MCTHILQWSAFQGLSEQVLYLGVEEHQMDFSTKKLFPFLYFWHPYHLMATLCSEPPTQQSPLTTCWSQAKVKFSIMISNVSTRWPFKMLFSRLKGLWLVFFQSFCKSGQVHILTYNKFDLRLALSWKLSNSSSLCRAQIHVKMCTPQRTDPTFLVISCCSAGAHRQDDWVISAHLSYYNLSLYWKIQWVRSCHWTAGVLG